MKKLLVCSCMCLGIAFGAKANGGEKTAEKKASTAAAEKNLLVEKRANHLSDQMIRELRLNNYQSRKIRAINTEKVAKMLAIEEAYAGNQELIDAKCKSVCAERDTELEAVLSTVQYNNYFGDRKVYTEADKKFVAGLNEPATPATKAPVVAPSVENAAQSEAIAVNAK